MTLPGDLWLILFSIAIAVITCVYFVYPCTLALGVFGRPQPVTKGPIYPLVSIIVAARNEESVIEEKLKNLLASDYPRGKVEILIGSDGSSDHTEEIVRRFAADGVGLLSFPQQAGKSAIQNGLVGAASGSLLAFTDADCFFSHDTLSHIVENFADPRVGLVTACPRYQNEDQSGITVNEGLYLRYESWLRGQESERGILTMASGSLFVLRRSLWQPLPLHLGDDFVLPLAVVRGGMRNVIEKRAIVTTHLTQSEPASMLQLKSRIVSKDFRGLLANADLLNPAKHGLISLALWCHKLLRWLIPAFLIALFVSNLFLLERPLCRLAFLLQVSFYVLALAGFLAGARPPRFISVPFSFCLVNLAAFLGVLNCFSRKSAGQWDPVRKNFPASLTRGRQ